MNISVVIPLYNEEESLPELAQWIERVMNDNGFSYEIIFVNDGSTDSSMRVIHELAGGNPNIHAISFSRNYGKSPALNVGFRRAKGDVVITMDADLQDSPDEIPELYRMITEEGYDLVSGWKKKRYDPLSKTIPTKLFNATARKVSGIKNLHDFNCGLKAYRNDVVKHIEVYGDMHRYIPYLAKNAGYKNRRKGSAPSGTQIRSHQIRSRQIHQRIPRPRNPLVSVEIRHKADAHIRSSGIGDVPDRFSCRCDSTYTQDNIDEFVYISFLCYKFSIFLSVARFYGARSAILLHRTHRRADYPQLI